jgi:hypothetical protein
VIKTNRRAYLVVSPAAHRPAAGGGFVQRAQAVLSALGSEGMLPRGRCQRFGAASGAGAGLNFLAGKSDLPAVVKTALAGLLFSGPLEFDAERDLLVDVPVIPSQPYWNVLPEPYVNPNAEIAATQAAYSAAVKAAMPPVRTAPMPTAPPSSLRRPGFA